MVLDGHRAQCHLHAYVKLEKVKIAILQETVKYQFRILLRGFGGGVALCDQHVAYEQDSAGQYLITLVFKRISRRQTTYRREATYPHAYLMFTSLCKT